MSWEWLPPTGTIIGAMITAGIGGWIGGRRSRKELEAQHRFEREQALTEHGRDNVDRAISALRYLQRHNRQVADGDFTSSDADDSEIGSHYDQISQAIPYLTDARARTDIALVHEILGAASSIERYSGAGRAPSIVYRACEAGLVVLGRYLRGEQWEVSEQLAALERHQAEAAEIEDEIYEQNQASYREWLKEQAASKKKFKTDETNPTDGDGTLT
ncbi:hypothetical protein ILP97_25110 [Amycolatopsis sp. H6(2020)]|nr:hypothetical protein [Amycolatopsis sp. H6(2020)]